MKNLTWVTIRDNQFRSNYSLSLDLRVLSRECHVKVWNQLAVDSFNMHNISPTWRQRILTTLAATAVRLSGSLQTHLQLGLLELALENLAGNIWVCLPSSAPVANKSVESAFAAV